MSVQASLKIAQVALDIEKGKVANRIQELGSADEFDDEHPGDNDKKSCLKGMGLVAQAVVVGSLSSVSVNIVAMVLFGQLAVYISGFIAVLMGTVVVVLQLQLEDVGSMRKVQNAMRVNVNNLTDENDKLTTENDKLETEVGKLQNVERELDAIVKKQGSNAKEFRALLKENRELMDQQKILVKSDAVQLITSVLIGADRNNDGTISEDDERKLELRLARLPGITVNKQAMRKTIARANGSMGQLLEAAYKVTSHVDDSVPQSERIFSLAVVEEDSDSDED